MPPFANQHRQQHSLAPSHVIHIYQRLFGHASDVNACVAMLLLLLQAADCPGPAASLWHDALWHGRRTRWHVPRHESYDALCTCCWCLPPSHVPIVPPTHDAHADESHDDDAGPTARHDGYDAGAAGHGDDATDAYDGWHAYGWPTHDGAAGGCSTADDAAAHAARDGTTDTAAASAAAAVARRLLSPQMSLYILQGRCVTESYLSHLLICFRVTGATQHALPHLTDQSEALTERLALR